MYSKHLFLKFLLKLFVFGCYGNIHGIQLSLLPHNWDSFLNLWTYLLLDLHDCIRFIYSVWQLTKSWIINSAQPLEYFFLNSNKVELIQYICTICNESCSNQLKVSDWYNCSKDSLTFLASFIKGAFQWLHAIL